MALFQPRPYEHAGVPGSASAGGLATIDAVFSALKPRDLGHEIEPVKANNVMDVRRSKIYGQRTTAIDHEYIPNAPRKAWRRRASG